MAQPYEAVSLRSAYSGAENPENLWDEGIFEYS